MWDPPTKPSTYFFKARHLFFCLQSVCGVPRFPFGLLHRVSFVSIAIPILYSCVSRLQRAVQHLVAARQDIDLYRRQRRFTAGPHRLLCTLVRSVLSTMMMALYPLQTGSMNCALCW